MSPRDPLAWLDDVFEEGSHKHNVYGYLCPAAAALTASLSSLYADPLVSFYGIPESTSKTRTNRLEVDAQATLLEALGLKRRNKAFYLEELKVMGRHRRKGVGREVFEQVEDFAWASDARAVFLHAGRLSSSPRSPHPAAFWKKMGFVEIASKPGTLDAVMVKTLF